MAKNQITGGAFQDMEGNPLNLGYLTLELTGDEQIISPVGQVCSGIIQKVLLDATGNIPVSPVTSVWPNDQLNPLGSQYIVNAYTAKGQLAWGPQYVTIPSSPSPYDVGNWVPSGTGTTGGGSSIVLQTNNVNNSSQSKLNLVNGSNIAITDGGSGNISIAATVPAAPTFKTNGVNNSSQTILNLTAGSNVTLTAGSSGLVTVAASSYTPSALANNVVFGGQGIWPPNFGGSNSNADGANLPAVQMILLAPFTFNKASIYSFSGASSSTITAAIYNYALTTKMVYLGDNAITVPGSSSGTYLANVSGGPVTLPAGVYWQVIACTSNISYAPNLGLNTIAALSLNKGSTKVGTVTASNPGSAIINGPLGGLSPMTGISLHDYVSFVWE